MQSFVVHKHGLLKSTSIIYRRKYEVHLGENILKIFFINLKFKKIIVGNLKKKNNLGGTTFLTKQKEENFGKYNIEVCIPIYNRCR